LSLETGGMAMDIKRMTQEEWQAEGIRRFGKDLLKWRFVCPVCKHVQSVQDFKDLNRLDVLPDLSYYNCIGRYQDTCRRFEEEGPGPCDYTTGGLFNFCPLRVL